MGRHMSWGSFVVEIRQEYRYMRIVVDGRVGIGSTGRIGEKMGSKFGSRP